MRRASSNAKIWLLPLVILAAQACKGSEPTVSAPPPTVASERDSTVKKAPADDSAAGFFEDDSTAGQTADQEIGADPASLQTGADPSAGQAAGTAAGPGVGATAAQPANPLAAVMPQLVQCVQNEACDPQQVIAAMPPATQQALMGAAEQYEQTGGGPLAPYAAQAEAAGIDLAELFIDIIGLSFKIS